MKKITTETLIKWEACFDGAARFNELFPEGETLEKAAYALKDDGHIEWGAWLYNQAREDDDFKEQAVNGFCNTGDYNTGDYNTGSYNTGSYNTGYRNTGDRNAGNWNTGDHNTGNWNTGYRNTGDRNTGYRNTGDYNTGDYNTGDYNTGKLNTGKLNTGSYNTGDRNTGYFNTITPQTILVFNKEVLRKDWDKAIKPHFIFNIELTYWVSESEMGDEDKKADPDFYIRGGQLRKRTYKDAWRLAYDSASKEDIELLKALPNFDADIFEEITGIRVE